MDDYKKYIDTNLKKIIFYILLIKFVTISLLVLIRSRNIIFIY